MLAVCLENGALSVRQRARPRRPEGFALIRLLFGGICNTDLELKRGYYGFRGTPGHEFVGEVVEADDRRWIGERVVGDINLACGNCAWCARGLGRHCPTRKVLGIVKQPGAFREFLTLPERNSSSRRSRVASVTGSRKGMIESSSSSSASRTLCALGSVKAILQIAALVTISNLSQYHP